jgi:hypothetical protein
LRRRRRGHRQHSSRGGKHSQRHVHGQRPSRS